MRRQWTRNRSFLALLAVLALLLTACGGDDTALEEADEEGQAEGLAGETITVSGEISRVVNAEMVIIGGDFVSFGVDEGTLVFDIPEGSLTEASEGSFIRATGTVEEFVASTVDEDSELSFDYDLVGPFEEEFALRAESVEIVPEEAAEGGETAPSEAEEDEVDEAA